MVISTSERMKDGGKRLSHNNKSDGRFVTNKVSCVMRPIFTLHCILYFNEVSNLLSVKFVKLNSI
jgi:hypothetical protein